MIYTCSAPLHLKDDTKGGINAQIAKRELKKLATEKNLKRALLFIFSMISSYLYYSKLCSVANFKTKTFVVPFERAISPWLWSRDYCKPRASPTKYDSPKCCRDLQCSASVCIVSTARRYLCDLKIFRLPPLSLSLPLPYICMPCWLGSATVVLFFHLPISLLYIKTATTRDSALFCLLKRKMKQI